MTMFIFHIFLFDILVENISKLFYRRFVNINIFIHDFIVESDTKVEVGHVEVGHVEVSHVEVGHVEVGHVEVGHVEVGHVDVSHVDVSHVDVSIRVRVDAYHIKVLREYVDDSYSPNYKLILFCILN